MANREEPVSPSRLSRTAPRARHHRPRTLSVELAQGLHVRALGPVNPRLDGLPFALQQQPAQTDPGPMPAFAAARRRQQSDWKALPTAFHTRQFPAVMPDRLPLSSGTTDNDLAGYRWAALRRPRWPPPVFRLDPPHDRAKRTSRRLPRSARPSPAIRPLIRHEG